MKSETKYWHEIKTFITKNNCKLSFTRLENSASWGTLIYWAIIVIHVFFTVELKVAKSNKVIFSPHQIAFHVKHPKNSFILVKTPEAGLSKLYEGSCIRDLAACGLKLDACCLELDACCLHLERLVLDACGLLLVTCTNLLRNFVISFVAPDNNFGCLKYVAH